LIKRQHALGAGLEHAPRFSDAHLFRSGREGHVLVVDGSRVFDVDDSLYEQLELAGEEGVLGALLERLGLRSELPAITDEAPLDMPVRALSLAVAQSCNLACTYCYAQQGGFGTKPQAMPLEVALRSVEMLLGGTAPHERVNLAFLGGEPLANRPVIRAATHHAKTLAAARGQEVTFSITTNGTLVTEEDATFFEDHRFAVTVSMDGPREAHDRLRPFRDGGGSYERIVARIGHLLKARRQMQVTARVTVTPSNLGLPETLEDLLALGFDSVGFSPTLASPNGKGEMDGDALQTMLSGMIACGEVFEEKVLAGQPYAFSNMMTALAEIHRGTHRPYPCGAGAGYLGVSASGELGACHRFVGDTTASMGNLSKGIDQDRRRTWMVERHVHRQEPCSSCWARYLCGGGCHHEVLAKGRHACDFIRGWLNYCLSAYVRLTAADPALFDRISRRPS
jgi:uncharacterized protein